MKIYKFVGNGLGVPGLPHTIRKSEGDEWMKESDRAIKVEKAAKKTDEGPFQAQQLPGAILKGALANGNYIESSTVKGKVSSGKNSEEKENN